MAIYHLVTKTFSRGKGQSAVAAAAYRSGENLHSELDQAVKRARTGSEIRHTEIQAPDGAPAWATDREALWNAAEARESRKDARLAREVQVALPRELDEDAQRTLVRGFVAEQFVAKGMVADVAYHEAEASDGQTNPHAHILLTVRGIGEDGWDRYAAGGKDRPWNKRERLGEWRESWERHVNASLTEAGSGETVDRRSLADRGIDRAPEPKLGPELCAMEKRGVRTEKGERLRRIRQLRANQDALAFWAKRQKQRESQLKQPRAADMDWLDANRSVGVEVAMNGHLPPEVRERMEAMRRRVIDTKEARNQRRNENQAVKRYARTARPSPSQPNRGSRER